MASRFGLHNIESQLSWWSLQIWPNGVTIALTDRKSIKNLIFQALKPQNHVFSQFLEWSRVIKLIFIYTRPKLTISTKKKKYKKNCLKKVCCWGIVCFTLEIWEKVLNQNQNFGKNGYFYVFFFTFWTFFLPNCWFFAMGKWCKIFTVGHFLPLSASLSSS